MAYIYNMAEEEGVKEEEKSVKEKYPVGTYVKYLGGDEKKKYEKYGKIHKILEANNIYLIEITTLDGIRYERVLKSNIDILKGGRKKSHRRKQKSRKHKSRRNVNKRGLNR
jgi:hypothetical protein